MTEPPLQINSVRHLSARLGVRRAHLADIASRAQTLYAPFSVGKRERPFQRERPTGAPRRIDNPKPALKEVQRRIYRRLLAALPPPENVLGGVAGMSVFENARRHAGVRELVTMDVRSYFPSITSAQVFDAWRRLGCGTQVASILTRLTTLNGHVPQGAPTSTALANLVQRFTFLPTIQAAANAAGCRLTTWVDDIAVSGPCSRKLISPIARALSLHGFRVSRRKTAVRNRGQRQEITGLVLRGNRVSISRARQARIRAGIHKLMENKIPAAERARYLRSLEGSIAFVARADPRRGNELAAGLRATLAKARRRGL